jgi:rhamnogalacturonan endolyase
MSVHRAATAAAMTLALGALTSSAAHAQECASWGKQGALLHADSFAQGLSRWVPEYRAGAGSSVAAAQGKLTMDVAGDATVWFKPELSGDVQISYRRTMLMRGGPNDRLSDLNQFWMASDPRNANLFTRDGTFAQYDALSLYYMGMGGNSNTTTRFRKYDGKGQRVLLGDLADSDHLLLPNREYQIDISVYQGCTRIAVDGETYFTYRDPEPLRKGYFGFRTTHSRQEITDFKVYRLE